MSKYYKAEDVIRAIAENLCWIAQTEYGDKFTTEDWLEEAEDYVSDLPTIEVSEGNQVLYGTDHNCILTMFGECSYNETGCGDCAVAEKIRKALSVEVSEDNEPTWEQVKEYCFKRNYAIIGREIPKEYIRESGYAEVSEDCISKAYLEQEIENQIMPAIDREMYWRGWNNALGKVVELIEDAPSVVPTIEQSCETCANIYCYQDAYYCDEIEEETEVELDDGCDKWKPREPKEGEWTNAGILTVHCSNCKSEFHELEAMNYCPNCGAKMKGAGDEAN